MFMHRVPLFASALCGLLIACGEEKKEPPPPDEAAISADEHLANGRLYEANKGYEAALAGDPQHRHAAFGAALTSLLLVPDSAPITELLDVCGQPHLGVEGKIFGPNGVLAQEARNRAGSATLELKRSQTATGSLSAVPFVPNRVRSTSSDEYLSSNLYQVVPPGAERAPDVYVSLSRKDVYSDDASTTPLQDGMPLELSRLPYAISVYDAAGYSSTPLSGTVVFRGGQAKGNAFTLEFQDAHFIWCESGASECSGRLRLHGSITDSFNADPVLNPLDLPFAQFKHEQGPPERAAWVAAIERCGSMVTTDLLAEKARALAGGFDRISERLTIAAGSNPADFQFVIPRSLLFIDGDVPLNGSDLLALRALTRATSAALRLAASYRYVDGPLTALIGDFDEWTGEPPTVTRKRGLLLAPLVENLQSTLFTLAVGEEFTAVRAGLDAALGDLNAVLLLSPAHTGLLNFQATQAQAFSGQLSEQVSLVRQSLSSSEAVTFARNPLYGIHLARLFDPPFDRTQLLAHSGLTELVTLTPGNPSSPYASERNDTMSFASPADMQELATWLGGMVQVPARDTTACTMDAQCPSSYTCDGSAEAEGRCREPFFVPVEQAILDDFRTARVAPFLTTAFESLERSFR